MTEGDLARLGVAAVDKFHGVVGVRRGAIVGYAVALWTDGAPALISLSVMTGRPWWLAIEARKFLREIPAEISEMFTLCDHGIPRAQEFLVWLGFKPTTDVVENQRIWVWNSPR